MWLKESDYTSPKISPQKPLPPVNSRPNSQMKRVSSPLDHACATLGRNLVNLLESICFLRLVSFSGFSVLWAAPSPSLQEESPEIATITYITYILTLWFKCSTFNIEGTWEKALPSITTFPDKWRKRRHQLCCSFMKTVWNFEENSCFLRKQTMDGGKFSLKY